jgi:ATP-dependent helicase/nuclease subunit A
MTPPSDHAARDGAIRERRRNVIIDASAGTGKTSLIVERLVELVAPIGGEAPIPIERIAAITFTRKAAGELRVRVRHRILELLAAVGTTSPRAVALRSALDGVDTAHIGTIHGFADRLLRRWPAHAALDPLYALADDDRALVDECVEVVVHGAESGSLGQLLAAGPSASLADEATATIRDALRAGLRRRSWDTEHRTYHGLDGLIAGFIRHRDVALAEVVASGFDRPAFEHAAGEYVARVAALPGESPGSRWLRALAEVLQRAIAQPDPVEIFREVVDRAERGPCGRASVAPRKSHEFLDDPDGWTLWKDFDAPPARRRATPLREELLAPLRQWLATRLVRLRPVVLDVYEAVKARHRVVDHVDLLLRLRNLLRDEPAIRRACQASFDHLFVDELQDTDPLQAEIVVFLCERGDELAATWDEVRLGPGTLTVVGDPKQSIYRFRRADLATYRRLIDVVGRAPHLSVRLTSSFRAAPGLVEWVNDRFATILGAEYEPLSTGRASGPATTVHVVDVECDAGTVADACRAVEADAMTRYVRWLVEHSGLEVVDPLTDAVRPVGYGDVAVLAITTMHVPMLFAAFDRDGVPYASRGGHLFLGDPLQRRFLLGLSSLADRDDGVAHAALLRPPFFALDLGDLARARPGEPTDRVEQARAVIRELRRRRFERSPGATARALLEQTAIGRVVALGPNGAQRIAGLRELCFQVEARALADGVDFDAAMERLRGWIDRPAQLDRPHPLDGDAVQVLTVHQAKGLEFPVVVLWDARALWAEPAQFPAWMVDPGGGAWQMRLETLRWSDPSGADLVTREREHGDAERRRLVYVAATRARDLIVLPRVGAPDERWVMSSLVGATETATVHVTARHAPDAPAPWYVAAAPPARVPAHATTALDRELDTEWHDRCEAVLRPRLRPTGFAAATSPRAFWGLPGRFGRIFGETVHLAIGLVLREGLAASAAVAGAARRAGLASRLADATVDVERAVAALRELGVARGAPWLQLEYPVAGIGRHGELVSGYVDLVVRSRAADPEVTVIDFKTDLAPAAGDAIPARYDDQVRGYAHALAHGLGTSVRAGLLYTADGGIRWLVS